MWTSGALVLFAPSSLVKSTGHGNILGLPVGVLKQPGAWTPNSEHFVLSLETPPALPGVQPVEHT